MRAFLIALLLSGNVHARVDRAQVRTGANEPPKVSITSPTGGWTSNRVVHISGTISDPAIELGTISVNGADRPLPLRAGAFDISLVMAPGQNVIEVVARNAAGEGRDKVSFFAKVPKLDLRVILSWDTDHTDLDLHVKEPSGEESWYGHRETASGGSLDVDVTDGYGPEIYTQANAQPGTYTVFVSYFSDHGNAQSEVKVDVLLYEGTEREEHLTMSKMLTRTGDRLEVGSFEVKSSRQVE
jgi:uncharacterized protein YfaP (DUF2135 family)